MFNPKYSRSVTFSALRPSALPIWKCKKRPTEHPLCCEASILAAFSQGAGLTPQSWKASNCLGAGLSSLLQVLRSTYCTLTKAQD